MGLERGIKRLSDLNVLLALMLLAFILIAGPSLFIVELGLRVSAICCKTLFA